MQKDKEEGVYGENIENGDLRAEDGIREQTVESHPQATGDESEAAREAFSEGSVDGSFREDVDSARKEVSETPNTTGEEAEVARDAIETTQDVTKDLDDVRDGQADEAGSGGMGRDSVPRNEGDASQGEFARDEDDQATTPG